MRTIYEPSGLAREYAPLALNIYNGCTHGCRYCYVPAMMRRTPEAFHSGVKFRHGLLEALPAACRNLKGDPRRIHLCFTCDPWPAIGTAQRDYTAEVLDILASHSMKISTLTKAPLRAVWHAPLLRTCDAHFGVSLAWMDDVRRQEHEPGAQSVVDRMIGLQWAKSEGLHTWASIEPVVDPEQGLAAIEALIPLVDEIKVGRLNHSQAANAIDWRKFAIEAHKMLSGSGKTFMLKSGLKEFI